MKIQTTYRQMFKLMFQKLRLLEPVLIPLCFIYTLCAAIYPILGVYLPRLLITQIESAEGFIWQGEFLSSPHSAVFTNIILIIGGYFILASITGGLAAYIKNSSYQKFSYLRLEYLKEINQKILTMDFEHYEDARMLDRINRTNQAVMSNSTGVEETYRQSFLLPAQIIALIYLIVTLGQADLFLIIMPTISFIAVFVAQNLSDRFDFSQREERSHASRKLNHYADITQDFTYGKDVRLFNLKNIIFDAYAKMINDLIKLLTIETSKDFKYKLLPLVIQVLSTAVTLMFLVHKAIDGQIQIAEFAFYLTAYAGFNLTALEISTQVNKIADQGRYVKEALDLLVEDLNQKSGHQDFQNSAELQNPDNTSTPTINIELKDVSFHYPGSEKLVLENFNLKINHGEKLALVGINGAGKSTLVKLITGLHIPTSGSVLINGQDTKNLSPHSLFKLFGVVFQDEKPISFTVAEHIASSLENIDREKVVSVLKRTELYDKIMEKPKGIDTTLLNIIDPDGLMLSGGQTQKLMLARALYKDAPVIILDEPTSALDALAETKVYQEFSDILTDKTGLFISHRLASTSFCDRIVLLSGGVIAETGTHQELMNAGGQYHEMFVTQGKYYQSENSHNFDNENEGSNHD